MHENFSKGFRLNAQFENILEMVHTTKLCRICIEIDPSFTFANLLNLKPSSEAISRLMQHEEEEEDGRR
jgi:hypothetical protein